jgi:hypothetical protein
MNEGRARAYVLTAAGLAALGAFAFAWTPLYDVDWPWHLATFELAAKEHRFIWDAPWSYASEGMLPPCHWLFELALGLFHRTLGLDGIELLRALLVAAVFAALARALVRRGLGTLPAVAVALTVAAATRTRFLERPHLVTWIAIVFLWDLLVDFRDRNRKRLLALVPLFLMWANAHPGVVFGSILATGFLVAEAARLPLRRVFPGLRAMPPERVASLALWIGLGILATFANPAGPGLYPYLIGQRALQRDLNVLELRGLDFSQTGHFSFAAIVLVAAVVAIRQRRDVDLTDLGGALGFTALAVLLARETGTALIAITIALAPALAELVVEARAELAELHDARLKAFAWLFGLAFGFGLPAFSYAHMALAGSFGRGLEPGFYAVREADWILREKPAGPLWNWDGSGGYLLWRLDPIANPGWRVFTDGRTPLYLRAHRMPYFPDVELRYAPNLLVLDYRHLPWSGELERGRALGDRFALVHFSDGGRTYVRREGLNATLARRGYRHVFFRGVEDAREGWRLSIAVDERDPDGALKELLTRALAEEPDGAWANAAAAQAFSLLGRREEAGQAARRALAARPSLAEVRGVLEALDAWPERSGIPPPR